MYFGSGLGGVVSILGENSVRLQCDQKVEVERLLSCCGRGRCADLITLTTGTVILCYPMYSCPPWGLAAAQTANKQKKTEGQCYGNGGSTEADHRWVPSITNCCEVPPSITSTSSLFHAILFLSSSFLPAGRYFLHILFSHRAGRPRYPHSAWLTASPASTSPTAMGRISSLSSTPTYRERGMTSIYSATKRSGAGCRASSARSPTYRRTQGPKSPARQ